jgi:hypothetical protein
MSTVIDGHTSASNQPEEDTADVVVGQPVTQPPSEGIDPGTAQEIDDGVEAVEGYHRPEAAMTELWTAPESTELRDIGEASLAHRLR